MTTEGRPQIAPPEHVPVKDQTVEQFLAELERVATDWRYSTELVGSLVRSRWPAEYGDGKW